MRNVKLVCCSLILIIFSCNNSAHSADYQVHESRQSVWTFDQYDAATLGANMLINGTISASSAYLQDNGQLRLRMFKSRTFWRNFYQGALGGSLVYVGEKTMTMSSEYDYAILIGKQVSDLGTSMAYSAAYGENWFKNPSYLTDFGPLVLHWKWKNGPKPKVYLLPGSMIALSSNLLTNELDLDASLKTGLFIFHGDLQPSFYANFKPQGLCMFNIITLDEDEIRRNYQTEADLDRGYHEVLGHEAIHTRWSYFQLMTLDSSIDFYLGKQTNSLKYLQYQKQPLRFGADMGSLLFGGISYGLQQTGLGYEFTPDEYASSNLYDYQRTTTIDINYP